MAAASTDLFRKTARRWVGQIGAGGVNDNSTTTIPLSSTTNLPSTTGVTLVIDRVDANGVATPSKEETITGVVSGSNIISAVRGVEGTAQAHSAGAVVELLFSNALWNDFIDGMMAEHQQDGTHGTLSAPVFTSPNVITGINDTNNNEMFKFSPAASAVNEFTVANAATGSGPTLSATGSGTNIDINLVPKGTGGVKLKKRLLTATSYTTDTGTSLNCDNYDVFVVTAQAGDLKFNNPTGTPVDGQTLWLAVTGTGARALTYDTQFESSAAATLPTTTVTTARIDIGLVWRADTSKWHCVAVA